MKSLWILLFFSLLLAVKPAAAQEKGSDYGLPQYIKRMHFIVYHDDRSFANKVSWKAEYYYKRILRHFSIDGFRPWEDDDKCTIYIFNDRNDYVKYSGAPVWSGACQRDNPPRIYIYKGNQKELSNLINNILPHEMTHAIFHELMPRKYIPLWLDEGMAQYEEKNWGGGQMQDYLSKYVKDGSHIELNRLFSFSSYPSDQVELFLFYAQSASIIEYLRKRQISSLFGKFLLKIRHGKSVEQALRETYYPKFNGGIPEFEKYWIKYVKTGF